MPAAAQLTNGLRGTVPAIFNGERIKTSTFLCKFDIYWNMNENHEMFQSPYLHVNLALSLIRGENINDWVQHQLDKLRTKLAPGGEYQCDQEILWMEFRNTLTAAFTNTTERQHVITALHGLKMKGDDLDTYIAQFRALARKAGNPLDHPGTMDNFVGLEMVGAGNGCHSLFWKGSC